MLLFKSLIFIASTFTIVTAYDLPVDINVYPISPIPGHIYPSGQNISVAIAIDNAIAAFDFGFILNYELNGSFPNPEGGAPQRYVIASGGTAGNAALNSTQDTVWIWNSSTFSVVPPGTSNMTFSWTYMMTTCSLDANVDDISTLSMAASFDLFAADDGTNVGPGTGTSEDMQIQVVSTLYSCPVINGATTILSTSLPTAEIVASATVGTGSIGKGTSTPGAGITTGSSANGNSPSAGTGSQSGVDPLQIGVAQILLAIMTLLGTLYVLF